MEEQLLTCADGNIPLVVERGLRPGPALLVVPSIFGVTDELKERLVEATAGGGVAIAIDPFWRTDPGPLPMAEMPRALARMQDYDPVLGALDVERVLACIGDSQMCRGGVVGLGVCFGGRVLWPFAVRGRLEGLAGWHAGGLAALVKTGLPRCPVALHFGDRDSSIPLREVDALRRAFRDRDDVDIQVHAGAEHGFSHRHSPRFHASAAEHSDIGLRLLLDRLR